MAQARHYQVVCETGKYTMTGTAIVTIWQRYWVLLVSPWIRVFAPFDKYGVVDSVGEALDTNFPELSARFRQRPVIR
jgi:hypothetical protein